MNEQHKQRKKKLFSTPLEIHWIVKCLNIFQVYEALVNSTRKKNMAAPTVRSDPISTKEFLE